MASQRSRFLKEEQVRSICPNFFPFVFQLECFFTEGDNAGHRPERLDLSTAIPSTVELPTPKSELNLTDRLETALGPVAPLLREIFIDFSGYLSKTLLGSHGQELLLGGDIFFAIVFRVSDRNVFCKEEILFYQAW